MHFYESSIITTKDGLHCQVYGNEHPLDRILVKPKYIPTDKVECQALQCRFISGRKMNRLNLWIEKPKLKQYLHDFRKAYPHYMYLSPAHKARRIFFTVPIEDIERIYFPRRGLAELMKMPQAALDDHLKLVYEFVKFLLKSGLRLKDLGITYSTLMGHYFKDISDINIVVY
jgi:predicted nucleotidyltransferase